MSASTQGRAGRGRRRPAGSPAASRAALVDHVAGDFLPRAALLMRLVARELDGASAASPGRRPQSLPLTEAALLNTLARGAPRRITELAEMHGVAQPTMTLLVKRLEQRSLVERRPDAGDGRVVLVALTTAGARTLADYLRLVRDALRDPVAELPDEELTALASATDSLIALTARFQDERQA